MLDTFHILARKTDLSAIRSIPATGSFWCRWRTHRCCRWTTCRGAGISAIFPGQGDLPLLDFMEALAATGYDGVLSLEIFNDQFRAGSARSVAVDGHRSLLFLLDQLAARNKASRPGNHRASAAIEGCSEPNSWSLPSTMRALPSSNRCSRRSAFAVPAGTNPKP